MREGFEEKETILPSAAQHVHQALYLYLLGSERKKAYVTAQLISFFKLRSLISRYLIFSGQNLEQ